MLRTFSDCLHSKVLLRLQASRDLRLQVQLDAARAEAAREAAVAEARAWAKRMAAVEAEATRERKDNQRLQAELHAARRGVPWAPKASEVQHANPVVAFFIWVSWEWLETSLNSTAAQFAVTNTP